MKKKSLLLTAVATLGLTAATMAQNVPSYVPTNGLVGWWPFNGNANDESGNGNNGTINGATLTIDRYGNAATAYEFDGNNDKINGLIPNSINTTQVAGLTISGWMWLDSNSLGLPRTLAYLRDGVTGSGYTLVYDQVLGRIKGMGGPNGQAPTMEVVGNNPPVVNTWYFVSMTCDFNLSTTRFYINSILQENTSDPLVSSNLNEFGFGKLTLAWDHFGKLDDIGIWNRVLTQQEITDLYNGNICYQTITVTDTLLINMGITGFNPVTYNNTIKIFPNPTNDHITINYGNFPSLNGYQLKIENSLGQQVFQTNINQQSDYLNLTNWGGNGLYFVRIIDPQGNTVDIRKIVLQ